LPAAGQQPKSKVFINVAGNPIFLMNCGDTMLPEILDDAMLVNETVNTVLEHIARYRLTIFPVLQRLPIFAACKPKQVKQVLRECQRRSLISVATLHHTVRYWYLDALGAQRFGDDEERIGPLSEPAKIRALAMIRFCCLAESPRHRLQDSELAQGFPDLYRPGLPNGYYFDPAASGRLGLLRIDAGRRGRWDRVIHSIRKDIAEHLDRPAFRRIIQAGRFEITVITTFRQKARRIYESLIPDARRLPIRVVAMVELLPLVASYSGKETHR
jgi:hypothetical protein